MSRRKIAAGNWKMNTLLNEGIHLASHLEQRWNETSIDMIVAPPFTHLDAITRLLRNSPIKVAAQNCHNQTSGAYTGDISPRMLKDLGVTHVIVGHSERREIFGESTDFLREKVNAALDAELEVIFCCGEPLDVREADGQKAYVRVQLEESLFHCSAEDMRHIVIAYEPIWAIGTGRTASPQQAQEMHSEIRRLVEEKYHADTAQSTTILYGGSVKPSNAAELFGQSDVDGGLVGGASLKAEDFVAIATALAAT